MEMGGGAITARRLGKALRGAYGGRRTSDGHAPTRPYTGRGGFPNFQLTVEPCLWDRL